MGRVVVRYHLLWSESPNRMSHSPSRSTPSKERTTSAPPASSSGGAAGTADDDAALVRAVLAGDPAAVDRFAVRSRFIVRILFVVNRRSGAPFGDDELHDLAQDVLALVWPRLSQYQGGGRLETWLYAFAVNAFNNARRKKQRYSASLERYRDAQTESEPPRGASGVDEEEVLAAVGMLGPPAADVIRMRVLDQLSFEEVARRLDSPTDTVKTWYYRGLRRLREQLRGREAG